MSNNRVQQRQKGVGLPVQDQEEDPRKRKSGEKIVKAVGAGRNTESFDPRSTLVRPDMRIIIADPDTKLTSLKHDDVVVIPNFFCQQDDWTLYNKLVKEVRATQASGVPGSEWISWHEGAHLISKQPGNSETMSMIKDKVSKYFQVTNQKVGTRFNWYRDSADWKPFHHDSAAFNAERAKNQNCTIGVSFGATRELAFLHTKSKTRIYFPQTNGMVFAFGRDVNIQWKHGVNYIDESAQQAEQVEHVGKCDDDVTVGRVSIILWGNCGIAKEEDNSPPMLTDNTRGNGHNMHAADNNNKHHHEARKRDDSRDRGRSRHHQDHYCNEASAADYDHYRQYDERPNRDGSSHRGRSRSRSRSRDRRGSYNEHHDHYHRNNQHSLQFDRGESSGSGRDYREYSDRDRRRYDTR